MKSEDVIILTDDAVPPYCKGCFNEHESCGTPCQSCEKAAQYEVKIIRVFCKRGKKK